MNPPSSFIDKEKLHTLKVEEEGRSREILVGLRIPENLRDDDDFRSVKDFFDFTHWATRPQGYDPCLADSAEGLYFTFVVFFWLLDQFPDESFAQDYKKKLFLLLKLIFEIKDARYYHKTPEGDLQIWWNHIDVYLPEATILEKVAFVWYLYYKECFRDASSYLDWRHIDRITFPWDTNGRKYLGVLDYNHAESLFEELSMQEDKPSQKMKKTRINIPSEIAAETLIRCRRRCALCFGINGDFREKNNLQIAHIDDNPSNNNLENLVAVCLDHHAEMHKKNPLSKGFHPLEVKHYRDRLYLEINKVFASQTEIPLIESKSSNEFYQSTRDITIINSSKGNTAKIIKNLYLAMKQFQWKEVYQQLLRNIPLFLSRFFNELKPHNKDPFINFTSARFYGIFFEEDCRIVDKKREDIKNVVYFSKEKEKNTFIEIFNLFLGEFRSAHDDYVLDDEWELDRFVKLVTERRIREIMLDVERITAVFDDKRFYIVERKINNFYVKLRIDPELYFSIRQEGEFYSVCVIGYFEKGRKGATMRINYNGEVHINDREVVPSFNQLFPNFIENVKKELFVKF